jgi:hypothetical protein
MEQKPSSRPLVDQAKGKRYLLPSHMLHSRPVVDQKRIAKATANSGAEKTATPSFSACFSGQKSAHSFHRKQIGRFPHFKKESA